MRSESGVADGFAPARAVTVSPSILVHAPHALSSFTRLLIFPTPQRRRKPHGGNTGVIKAGRRSPLGISRAPILHGTYAQKKPH